VRGVARKKAAAHTTTQGAKNNMPQNEHIELHQKRHGRRLDAEEKERKYEAREGRIRSRHAQKVHGIKARCWFVASC